jgi:type II secretory pathway pseudopilin PulG
MHFRFRRGRSLMLSGALIAAVSVLSAGCMQYAPDGTVATPPPSGESAGSRLPQLLSQLQGAGANVERLDGSQSQVLAAQDAQGKDAGSIPSATVAGEKTPGTTQTPAGTPTRATTPTRTPTPTRAPEGGTTVTPTPTGSATAAPTDTPTPTPSPTATPSPTPTSSPTPPSESGGGNHGTPPTE